MNIKRSFSSAKVFALATSILVLSGCMNISWFGRGKENEKDGGSVLAPASIKKSTKKAPAKASQGPKIIEFKDGSSMTMGDIDDEIIAALSANPYTKTLTISQITPDMKELFFKDVMNRKLVDLWAEENNVEQDAQFQADLAQTYKMLTQVKKGEWFSNQIKTKISSMISDKDVKKTYDQNKSRYVKTAGGVRVAAVKFATSDDAKTFLDSANPGATTTVKDFELLAKTALNGTFKDFGRISEESPRGAHKALLDEAMSRKTFPSIEIVKVGDDEFWVSMFESEKESVYFTFDEVKDQIRAMAENEKFAELIEAEIKNLEKKFVKTIDRTVFKNNAEAVDLNAGMEEGTDTE